MIALTFLFSVQFVIIRDSPDALSQHLIIKHKDSVVDPDTDDDDTLYDENDELNLGMLPQLSVL